MLIRSITFSLLLALGLISPATAQTEDLERLADALASHDRPGAEQGPTRVHAAIFLMDLFQVLDVEQTIRADFLVEARWSDPSLALAQDAPGRERVRHFGLDEIWHPMIQVENLERVFPQLIQRIIVDGDGRCAYVQRFIGSLSCPLNLRRFPFDAQLLYVQIVSMMHSTEDLEFTIDEALAGRSEKLTIADWRVGEVSVDLHSILFRPEGLEMAGIRLSVPARRHESHYVFKVIAPLVVILIMSWAVFWIDPVHVGPQIGIAATSLLTMIAYRFSLGNLIPKVSYLTRLDFFIFGATVFVLVALVETLVSAQLVQRKRVDLARRLDRWFRLIAPLATLGLLWLSFR